MTSHKGLFSLWYHAQPLTSAEMNDRATLAQNTERFLRTMAESGKHDMLIGLKETKSDFDINCMTLPRPPALSGPQ